MTRLFPAILALLVVGCAAPRATVVEEAPKKKSVARNTGEPVPLPPEIGLRDPDVVSELPDATGPATPPVPPISSSDDRPTVIARPPSEAGADSPTPSGTN